MATLSPGHGTIRAIHPRASRPSAAAGTPARADARLALTARGRRLLVLLAFLVGLVVAAAALLVFDVPSALAGTDGAAEVTVTVEAGDTLSGYAEQYAPEGVSAEEFLVEVHTLNHLPTGRLTAGQQIVLPAAEGAGR